MPIMVAKKRSGQKTANYFFSLNTVDPKPEGRSYIGKLRQLGDKGQYSLFGQGENPNKTVRDEGVIREQYSRVCLSNHDTGTREFKIIIPQIQPNGQAFQWRPFSDKKEFLSVYLPVHQQQTLVNNKPRYSQSKRTYVLDFKGRVSKSSIKNF